MNQRTQFGIGLISGVGAAVLVGLAAWTTTKRMVFVLAALTALLVMALAKDREKLALFGLVFSIPLNINYFLFGMYANHVGGAVGLYLLPCDLALFFLYGFWFFDWAMGHNVGWRRRPRFLLYFLPFLTLGCVSILYSTQPSWAIYEWLRWVRFAAILAYVTLRLKPKDITFALSALAGAVFVQSAIAVAQTLFQTNFAMNYLGIAGRGSETVFIQGVGTAGSIVRGAGTTGHPNTLGSYLVLTLFVFTLLYFVETAGRRRVLFFSTALMGIVALGATLSRSAWISFAAAAVVALLLAIWTRLLNIKVAIGIVVLAVTATTLTALPFTPILAQRIRADWDESVEFRVELNRTAIDMALDHPIGGVGLNNFTIIYPSYEPRKAEGFRESWGALRVVHNIYLLVWSELGTIGLFSFFGFWASAILAGLSVTRSRSLRSRAVVVGFASGFSGLLVYDLANFALWVDATMYTCALLVGLLELIAAGLWNEG